MKFLNGQNECRCQSDKAKNQHRSEYPSIRSTFVGGFFVENIREHNNLPHLLLVVVDLAMSFAACLDRQLQLSLDIPQYHKADIATFLHEYPDQSLQSFYLFFVQNHANNLAHHAHDHFRSYRRPLHALFIALSSRNSLDELI